MILVAPYGFALCFKFHNLIEQNRCMSKVIAPKKTYELLAVIFLLPALFIQVKWLNIFYTSDSLSPTARTSAYLDEFPAMIASSRIIALISLAFSVAAVIFASRSFNVPKAIWRISSFFVVMIGSLIVLLSLFQLF
jgi:hypothetical protein